MNSREVELALKKQRLQLRSATLRGELAMAATGLAPLFATADHIGEGLRWLREHQQLVVAGLVALLVARPRAVLRWGRRGWFVWQALQRLRGGVMGTP